MEDVYRRTQVAEYGFFAVTLGVQTKSGGGLAETLQTLADTVRQRVGMAARAKALAGEVIFSARALSFAPFIVGGVLYSISHAVNRSPVYGPDGKEASRLCGGLGPHREPGDTLDDQKGHSPMTSGLVLAALALATAALTAVLIVNELHIRALNMRVSKAVMGVPGRSAPLRDVTGWLSSLGTRYRRFYSAEDLDQLRAIVQSSGIQSSSDRADLDRRQSRQHGDVPAHCLVHGRVFREAAIRSVDHHAHRRGGRNHGAAIDSVVGSSGVLPPPFGGARRTPSTCWWCAAKREWAWRARWTAWRKK